MKRRTLLTSMLSAPLLTACWGPRFFDIGWDEEVRLNDGRLIVVTVKYTYERLGTGLSFSRYTPSILRNTELTVDELPSIGRFNQVFRKHRVNSIEWYVDRWYLLLQTRGGPLTVETADGRKEEWGSIQNASGYKCWSLDQRGLHQASLHDLPASLLAVNMLMDFAPTDELAALNGTRVTLSQKSEFLSKYPINPSDQRIERP